MLISYLLVEFGLPNTLFCQVYQDIMGSFQYFESWINLPNHPFCHWLLIGLITRRSGHLMSQSEIYLHCLPFPLLLCFAKHTGVRRSISLNIIASSVQQQTSNEQQLRMMLAMKEKGNHQHSLTLSGFESLRMKAPHTKIKMWSFWSSTNLLDEFVE